MHMLHAATNPGCASELEPLFGARFTSTPASFVIIGRSASIGTKSWNLLEEETAAATARLEPKCIHLHPASASLNLASKILAVDGE